MGHKPYRIGTVSGSKTFKCGFVVITLDYAYFKVKVL